MYLQVENLKLKVNNVSSSGKRKNQKTILYLQLESVPGLGAAI